MGGTNNNICSAYVSGDTVINKSTLYVQSGLEYNNLLQMSRKNSLQYITLGHKTTTILVLFPKGLGCSAIGKVDYLYISIFFVQIWY